MFSVIDEFSKYGINVLNTVNYRGMGWCSHLVVLFLFGRRSLFLINFLVRVRLTFSRLCGNVLDQSKPARTAYINYC